eukprot:3029042-Rhodomonas_salina.2
MASRTRECPTRLEQISQNPVSKWVLRVLGGVEEGLRAVIWAFAMLSRRSQVGSLALLMALRRKLDKRDGLARCRVGSMLCEDAPDVFWLVTACGEHRDRVCEGLGHLVFGHRCVRGHVCIAGWWVWFVW